jgi:dephospho-CoA kinase
MARLEERTGIWRVALTGGIATGKSYVRARFEELGVPTIDADVLARDAVAPGTPGLEAVIQRFGSGVLDSDGTLNRAKLASIVFADPEARHALEAILHPAVRQATNTWFASLDPRKARWAIADIPLLYEVGRDRDFDVVIVAACAPDVQIRRVVERDRLSEAEARQRIAAQLPIDEKAARANYVIRTDGTFAETEKRVRDVYEELASRAVTRS